MNLLSNNLVEKYNVSVNNITQTCLVLNPKGKHERWPKGQQPSHSLYKKVECHTKGLQTPMCLELNYVFIQAEFIYEKNRDFIKRY